MRQVVINGKFLSAPATGVHRVAAELANALADLKSEDHPTTRAFSFEVWMPHNGAARAASIRLPVRIVGPLTGIPWEQLTLSARIGDRLLVNLCNIGPPLVRNAITMIHDAQVHISPASYSRGFRAWYRLIQPAIGRRHRRILTVSNYSKDEISRAGLCLEGRISVVHNGVNHMLREAANPIVTRTLGLTPRSYILALSSVQAHKNIAVLLDAFSDPKLSALKLVLFGGTTASDFAQAGHGVPPNAVFAGRIGDDALRGLMTDALCIAFPSTTEGFGLPPMEAMLLGCPAVVAPCGALPEVCGDAAIYANPKDANAWVDAFCRLRDDPAFWECRANEAIAQASKFSWREAALSLVRVLEEVAS